VHQGRLQLTVHKLSRQTPESIDQADFFPASARDLDEMIAELRSTIDNIATQPLRDLLNAFIGDPEILGRLRVAPAAKNVHHAFLGGLLEHVLSMCAVAKFLGTHYRDIDLDLLLSGVILHDIGKIHELTYDRSFGYSTEGQLIGHISIGFRMIDDKIRGIPSFPERLRTLLQHMILSHHGELEYGSPKVPLFPEALLLHHIDNMDSKMECMLRVIERDRTVDSAWTSYVSPLERSVLKKRKYLDPPVEAPAIPAPIPVPVSVALPQHAAAVAAAVTRPASPAQPSNPTAQPPRPVFQRATSAFAEKLKGALGGRDPQ
jgi:3'-5' exoribonuclease